MQATYHLAGLQMNVARPPPPAQQEMCSTPASRPVEISQRQLAQVGFQCSPPKSILCRLCPRPLSSDILQRPRSRERSWAPGTVWMSCCHASHHPVGREFPCPSCTASHPLWPQENALFRQRCLQPVRHQLRARQARWKLGWSPIPVGIESRSPIHRFGRFRRAPWHVSNPGKP